MGWSSCRQTLAELRARHTQPFNAHKWDSASGESVPTGLRCVCLDSELVERSGGYLAVLYTAWAAVHPDGSEDHRYIGVLLIESAGHGRLSTKDLSERCGPSASDCPPRLLDLVPTPGGAWAAAWRERCRASPRWKVPAGV